MPSRRSSPALVLFLSATLCLIVAPAPAHAKPDKSHLKKRDSKHQIEDMEEQWRLANLNADIPAMDRLLSDDYVGISMSGQVNTKAQQLDRLRSRSLVVTRLELSDVKMKLVDSVAIVTSLVSVEGTNEGASVSGLYRSTRVYQRLPSGVWKITNFESTRVPPGRNRLRPDPNDEPPPRHPGF